jgi:hypothetical protein
MHDLLFLDIILFYLKAVIIIFHKFVYTKTLFLMDWETIPCFSDPLAIEKAQNQILYNISHVIKFFSPIYKIRPLY